MAKLRTLIDPSDGKTKVYPITILNGIYDSDGTLLSNGIPKKDLATDVQTSLGKADTSYQKASTGIPKTDLATDVQTSLGKADAAAPLNNAGLTGTPTAPTAAAGTNTTQIATTAFVESEIASKIASSDAMIYKGTVNSNSDLPSTTAKTGWTYKVATAGTYAGVVCEIGDMIICLTGGSSSTAATWTIIQNNIDGAVTGPTSSTADHIATFNGTTGKVVKDSGYTIATSVPSGAVFTDTDTKVTAVGNHYTPTKSTTKSASGGTVTDITNSTSGTNVVTGVEMDAAGHVTGVTSVALKSVNTNTTYSDATTTVAGLMSTTDKTQISALQSLTDSDIEGWFSV